MKHVLITFLLFLTANLQATELYKVGDVLNPFTVRDQHDKEYTFTPGLTSLLVSFDMASGKKANRWFATKSPVFLTEHQSAFLSDIHGMPGVGRVFALPKMRKYPHRILLGDNDQLLERYPRQEGRLTLFRLDPSSHITAIEFVDPEKDLPAVFKE